MTNQQWTPRAAIPGVNAQNPTTDEIVTVIDKRGVQFAIWRDGAPNGVNAFELHFARRAKSGVWKQHGALVTKNNPHLPTLAVAPDGTKVLAFEESTINGALDTTQHRIGVLEFTAASTPTKRKLLMNPGLDSDYHPTLAIDKDGVRHILFSRAGTILHASSLSGKHWISETVSPVSTQFYHPSLAVDGNDLYAAWVDKDTQQIWLSSLIDGVPHWLPAQVMGFGSQVQLAARDGKVVAAWSEKGEHTLAVRILSNDKWSEVERPAPNMAGSYHPHCCLDSKGNITISFMQSIGGENYQIYVAQRDANAWSKARALEGQSAFSEGNALCVGSDDVMHICYLSHESDGKRAFSTDSV